MRSAENPKRIRPRFLVRSDTPFLASIVSLFTPRAFDTSFVSWAEIPAKAITIAPIAAILAKIVPAALHKGTAFISDNFWQALVNARINEAIPSIETYPLRIFPPSFPDANASIATPSAPNSATNAKVTLAPLTTSLNDLPAITFLEIVIFSIVLPIALIMETIALSCIDFSKEFAMLPTLFSLICNPLALFNIYDDLFENVDTCFLTLLTFIFIAVRAIAIPPIVTKNPARIPEISPNCFLSLPVFLNAATSTPREIVSKARLLIIEETPSNAIFVAAFSKYFAAFSKNPDIEFVILLRDVAVKVIVASKELIVFAIPLITNSMVVIVTPIVITMASIPIKSPDILLDLALSLSVFLLIQLIDVETSSIDSVAFLNTFGFAFRVLRISFTLSATRKKNCFIFSNPFESRLNATVNKSIVA